MKTLAILGSARRGGNTERVLRRLIAGTSCEVVDLTAIRLAPFNYDQVYDDDFAALAARMLEADFVLLATPVYWYSYSAVMKQFIDRFSDFLSAEKDAGRKLRGKKFALLATGSDPIPDATMNQAFGKFCDYLGLKNQGCLYSQEDGLFTDANTANAIRSLLEPPRL